MSMQTERIIPLKPALSSNTGGAITAILLQQLWYMASKVEGEVCRITKLLAPPVKRNNESDIDYWKRVRSFYIKGTSLSEELGLSAKQIRYNMKKICSLHKDKEKYEEDIPYPDNKTELTVYYQHRLKRTNSQNTNLKSHFENLLDFFDKTKTPL